MAKKRGNLGIQYIRETKFDRQTINQKQKLQSIDVAPFKRYPDAEKIDLIRTWDLFEARITPLLQNRRSLRKYSPEPISIKELSFLLWASQGITAQSGKYYFRTAPSGGALYPIETYVSVHCVEGLQAGLYHFDPEMFRLERLTEITVEKDLSKACLNQTFISSSSVTFIWSAVFYRNMNKYGDRGLRYVLLDAGHICQNLLIAAEAINCGGCPVGAFFDEELNDIIDIDGEQESVLYLGSIGKKA